MKKIAIALIVGVGLFSILWIGLALAVTFTPLRAQIGQVIARVAQRANLDFDFGPRSTRIAGENQQADNGQMEGGGEGILIAGVLEGSPADQAGLRRGDILLAVNAQAVNSLPDLVQAMSDIDSGDAVELGIRRGDENLTLAAQAADTADRQEFGLVHTNLLGMVPCTDGEMMRGFGGMPDFKQAMHGGALITNVVSGSPAEEAGLKEGEWITAINGETIALPEDITHIIQQSEPGDELTLMVEDSEGQQREVTVILAQKEGSDQAWLGVSLGASFEHRLPGFGDPKGPGAPGLDAVPHLPEGYENGAVILEVTPGGAAEKAGLQAGQVIVAVDDQELTSAEELKASIAALEPGDQITLTVSGPEDATTRDVTVTLGENPDKSGTAYLGVRFGYIEFRQETSPGR